jgi:hypothetical protein
VSRINRNRNVNNQPTLNSPTVKRLVEAFSGPSRWLETSLDAA